MLHINEEDVDRITEAIYLLLTGKPPRPIQLPDDYPDNEIKQCAGFVNQLVEQYTQFAELMAALSRGELELDPPRGKMAVLQSFKNLHANLRHLTYKTQQIAGGDLTQRVDFMGDFSVAFNRMTQQLKDAYEVIREEKEKSDRLLLNILPASVANDLKETGRTTPEHFEDVTVFFSDLVGFTKQASQLAPTALIEELNEIFTAFDAIADKNHCERLKTIGDAYLAVCGMPEPDLRHAENIVNMAMEIVEYMRDRNAKTDLEWKVRIGVHTGSVVGGVVGVKKYIYDVFGDTINTASRMESNSEPMRINVSEATYRLLAGKYKFAEREEVEVKGKGAMKMYFLET